MSKDPIKDFLKKFCSDIKLKIWQKKVKKNKKNLKLNIDELVTGRTPSVPHPPPVGQGGSVRGPISTTVTMAEIPSSDLGRFKAEQREKLPYTRVINLLRIRTVYHGNMPVITGDAAEEEMKYVEDKMRGRNPEQLKPIGRFGIAKKQSHEGHYISKDDQPI